MNRHVHTYEEKVWIFNKTGGQCYWCGESLIFENHGKRGSPGAWHIDHKYPLARGGSDEPHNWYPACIDCNQKKGPLRPGEHRKMEIPLGNLKYKWNEPPKW